MTDRHDTAWQGPYVAIEPPADAIRWHPSPSVRPEAREGGRPITQREAIEAALAAWRNAERRLTAGVDSNRVGLTREVTRHRAEFQRLSAAHMVERLGKLQEAESRRAHATPSTPRFHEAARDTEEIASDIWEAARVSDEDTPQTVANRRTTPRPARPGTADVITLQPGTAADGSAADPGSVTP